MNLCLMRWELRELEVPIDAAADNDNVLVVARCHGGLQGHDCPATEVGHEPLLGVLTRATLADRLRKLSGRHLHRLLLPMW